MKKTVSFSLDEKTLKIIAGQVDQQRDIAKTVGLDVTISASKILDDIIQDWALLRSAKSEPISISEDLERG